MCKVYSCMENHNKHYCIVCNNADSTHFSSCCPKGTIIYHGTKKQYADAIFKGGFKASPNGRIGPGVYFTKNFEEARQIAQYRFKHNNPAVIECIAEVDYRKFRKEDSEQVLLQKLQEWYKFCQERAKQGIHPPWANNGQFKQVCVKDAKAIKVIRVHTM